ncbi:MAG: ArsR family transcriptional regulator [Gallionella sp.]|jgi:DeoR/GlpR family transcriptional regulator of sugar metabolism|nr:ArsR family transcriptional regulator [Gallionella sp.]
MNKILQYLKTHGEKLDTDIASAAGISLATAHLELAELSAKGEVMSCHSIRFVGSKKIEGMSYRLSGYIPKAAPGRKAS